MILESPDEIRQRGVTVYDYRTPEERGLVALAQPDRIAHAVSILAGAKPDELETFARLFVAANAVNADMAINAIVCATYDEKCANIVDSIIAAIMAATDTQRDALAAALAQRDPHMADALATALDNALYDSQVPQRDAEAASIAADDALMGEVAPLDDDDDDDCRCLLAAAQ